MKRTLALALLLALAGAAPAAAKPPEKLIRWTYGCPAPPSEFTTKCEFRMKGTITLRRTGRKVLG
jgi:hypothetical protein